jgi:hypothetical protein
VRDDCRAAGVAVFVKEMGSRPIDGGGRLRLKDFAGGDWGEWPEDLRVRELPAGAARLVGGAGRPPARSSFPLPVVAPVPGRPDR